MMHDQPPAQFPRCLQIEHSELLKGGFNPESVIKLHKDFEEIFAAQEPASKFRSLLPPALNYRRMERGGLLDWMLTDAELVLPAWWLRHAAHLYCWPRLCRPVEEARLTPRPELWGGGPRRRRKPR